MRKRFAIYTLCTLSVLGANAIPFNNVTVDGTATVGAGGDYATLKDAANAFNSLSSPFIQGNWKLEVISDLTEPVNVGFGNTIPAGSSVTLKPAASLQPTITFTATADNVGPTGNLIVGVRDLTAGGTVWDLRTTNNFIIDGSNTVNGSSRDLTITNTGVTFNFSRIVCIIGDSNNCVIKNCRVINLATGGTTPAAISVGLRLEGTTNYLPDGFMIDNNFLRAQSTGPASGTIGIDLTRTNTTAASTGWTISNNDIEVRQRGIYLNGSVDGTITDNNILINGANASILCYGIYGIHGSTANNQTLNIHRNNIKMQTVQTAAGNLGCIGLGLSSSVGTGCVSNITNNMIHLEATAATGNPIRLSGTDLVSNMTHNFHHNSIYISASAALSGQVVWDSTNSRGVHALGSHRATTNLVANNNILHVAVPGGGVASRSVATGTWTSNNNDLSAGTGVSTGRWSNGSVYATLDNWKTGTSQDAGSFAVNPLTTTGSAWSVSGVADLHFVPANTRPVELPGVPVVAGITTDIDGDSRNAGTGGVYPGADELAVQLPVSLSSFSLE